MDSKRVAVFSYLRVRKGIDNRLDFSIPSIVRWCGNKPDTRSDGISKKYLDVVNDLKGKGYLTYTGELTKVAYTEGEFNTVKVQEECSHDSFAVIYLDELYKIMNYKKENIKDPRLNNSVLLLIFAFFRNAIYRRSNKLRPEEMNKNIKDDIKKRQELYPEAYADFYNEIATKINIPISTLTRAISILDEQLGLLVLDKAYRVQDNDGKYKTQYTIFANAYKREGAFLLSDGEDYSRVEIKHKAELLRKYNEKYIIDKRKRKSLKGDD